MTDVGTFLRLKSAVDSTLHRVESKTGAAKALTDAYLTFRSEAALIATAEGIDDEFERLFPGMERVTKPVARAGFDPIAAASAASEAQSLLTRLSGWLDGFVQKVRLEEDAAAYASERIRLENR